MRGFELTADKRRFLWAGLAKRPYPARIVWGELDPALGLDQLDIARRVLGVDDAIRLPAKHFLQEDQAPAVAQAIADLAAPLLGSSLRAAARSGPAHPARGTGSRRGRSRAGAIASGHRLARLREHGADVVAARHVDDGQHLDLGLAGDDRGLARRRVPGFGGAPASSSAKLPS